VNLPQSSASKSESALPDEEDAVVDELSPKLHCNCFLLLSL